MSEEKKYRIYTSVDIEKYHKGLLSPKEMNELEKAALDDPFLADALEGYGKVPVNISSDIEGLEKKLEQRLSGAKVISISTRSNLYRFLKVAAVVLFVAGAAFWIYKLAERSNDSVAVQKLTPPNNTSETPVATDTNKQGTTAVGNAGDLVVDANAKDFKTQQRSVRKNDSLQITSGIISQSNLYKSDDKVADVTSTYNVNVPAQDSLKIPPTSKVETNSKLANDAAGYVGYDKKSTTPQRKEKQAQPGAVSPYTQSSQGKVKADSTSVFYNLATVTPASQDREAAVKTSFFRGRVTDNNNNALPFANISNVKDNVGTYADAQGNFTLISGDSVLNVRVKSVGFTPDTLQLQGNLSLNRVVLQEDKVQGVVLSGRRQKMIPTPDQNVQVEESSEPVDGWNNYNLYLANNIKTPEAVQQKPLQQEVKLSFDINKVGEPVNIKIEKSNCKECDEEAIRLVKEGPKWKPKKKKSRVIITIPF